LLLEEFVDIRFHFYFFLITHFYDKHER